MFEVNICIQVKIIITYDTAYVITRWYTYMCVEKTEKEKKYIYLSASEIFFFSYILFFRFYINIYKYVLYTYVYVSSPLWYRGLILIYICIYDTWTDESVCIVNLYTSGGNRNGLPDFIICNLELANNLWQRQTLYWHATSFYMYYTFTYKVES